MEIRAASVFDYRTMKAFCRQSMFGSVNMKKMIICLVCFAVIMPCLIDEIFDGGFHPALIFLFVLFAVCVIIIAYAYFLLPKKQYKALGKMADTKNLFLFRADSMTVSSQTDDYEGKSVIKYSMLFKVTETKDFFLIFQNKASCYVVDKAAFEGGTAEELRAVLQGILGKQYIIRK